MADPFDPGLEKAVLQEELEADFRRFVDKNGGKVNGQTLKEFEEWLAKEGGEHIQKALEREAFRKFLRSGITSLISRLAIGATGVGVVITTAEIGIFAGEVASNYISAAAADSLGQDNSKRAACDAHPNDNCQGQRSHPFRPF